MFLLLFIISAIPSCSLGSSLSFGRFALLMYCCLLSLLLLVLFLLLSACFAVVIIVGFIVLAILVLVHVYILVACVSFKDYSSTLLFFMKFCLLSLFLTHHRTNGKKSEYAKGAKHMMQVGQQRMSKERAC